MKEEFVIETIVLPISAELCQELCYESSNCAVFQHSAENCTLLREDYRQDCETAGGPSVSKILSVFLAIFLETLLAKNERNICQNSALAS